MTCTETPIWCESRTQEGFYAPRFELKIKGAGLPQLLPREVLRDIVEVRYSDDVKEIDSVEIQVNNWDGSRFEFRYIGSEPANSTDARHTLFEPCGKEFELRMGYVGELPLMMTGSFTSLEPHFPNSGRPTLTVRGLNVLHQLRRKQYTYAWTDMSESAIADDLQGLRDRQTRRTRFPVPIEISREARGQEEPIPYLAQENQYDIDFLFSLARRRGYDVELRENDDGRVLYFGPSEPRTAAVEYTLEWGKTLVDFTPTLTTANQISSVTVNGWDRESRRPIRETARLDDPRLNRNEDLRGVLERCDAREERVVNLPVFTRGHARRLAEAILRERHKDFIKASGTTVGLPRLRAGSIVHIGKIGARFSGRYYVTSTTHTINDSGYSTKFKARRETQEPAS